MSEPRVLHCWEEGPTEEYNGDPDHWPATSTCFLSDGHDGPHEWTLDRDILIDFKPSPEAAS